ncbi:predicted protein [Naegleria gruberi]|uniref:Predicted protein n=1 Tax=Naegleria gruberi TaxID=5762 RepID=D2VXE2_NAEGR|nr:uncharacterized protein NAEGRDRAFT_73715 [Naegleria gruberi]EFC38424.1 predicted protein [Naegleria gruberi]|eukprot:XP_002671168.1 predicted protein [Naegleria gruberi strain NEG-M]
MIKGATVHFTDRQVLIPLIEKNIDLNCKIVEQEQEDNDIDEKAPILANQFKCFEYLWGEPNEIVENTEYDFVIGCDCIYESKDMWMPLSKALHEQLARSKNIILAHELRSQKDFSFWPHIQETFEVERVPTELLDEFWRCEAIRIFYLTFKSN